ncbi:TPA: hypothetical protein ROX79_005625 [Bacillus thuringiensis]|jgi:hypothetical protein|nr:hypothetical protein [Bacillus thuringiensis]
MPFHTGVSRAPFVKMSGLGEDLGVDATYKHMGYRENGRDVMKRHDAYVDDMHVETIEKYGKVYWNSLEDTRTYERKESVRDILLRADRCLRDYGYGLK